MSLFRYAPSLPVIALLGCSVRPASNAGSCTNSLSLKNVAAALRQPINLAAGGFLETLGFDTTDGLARAIKNGTEPKPSADAAYFDFFIENGRVRVLPISPYGNGVAGAVKVWASVYTLKGKYVKIPLVYEPYARKRAAVERVRHWDDNSLNKLFGAFDRGYEQDTSYPEELVKDYKCDRNPGDVAREGEDPRTTKYCQTPRLRTLPILDVDPSASAEVQAFARNIALWQEAERARVQVSPTLRSKLERLRELRFVAARAASMEESGMPFYEDQFCEDPRMNGAHPGLCGELALAKEIRARYTLPTGNINDRRPALGVTQKEFVLQRNAKHDAITRDFIALTLEASQQAWDEGAPLRLATNWLYDNRYDYPEKRSPDSMGFHALNIRTYSPVFDTWEYLLFKNGLLYQSMQNSKEVKNANLWYDAYGHSTMLVGNAWPLYARIRLNTETGTGSVLQPYAKADVVRSDDWTVPVEQKSGDTQVARQGGSPQSPTRSTPVVVYRPPPIDFPTPSVVNQSSSPPPNRPGSDWLPPTDSTFSQPVAPEAEQKRNWSERNVEPGGEKMVGRAGCN